MPSTGSPPCTLAANWSGDVTLKESHELIVRGPYQYVRHPIYTGLLTMVLATALSEGNLGAYCGALLIFAGTRVKMKIEEDLMLRHFPETYPGYQKRVKALIPFVI